MRHRNVLVSPVLVLAASFATLAIGAGGPPGNGPGPGPGPGSAPVPATEHFTGATACAPCHDGLRTSSGEDLNLVDAWRTSLMAHAFVDPFWQAKLRTELLRHPRLADLLEQKCAGCHAPMAYTEASKGGEPVRVFGVDGFLDPDHPYHGLALEGVSCTLCHQIRQTEELGTPAGASGGYSIADADAPEGRRIYGSYPDPFWSMVGVVDYLPIEGAQVLDSSLCATCHDLETPYVDVDGNVVSTPDTLFPEQSPYTEWLDSDLGPGGATPTHCQECHLGVAGDARIAARPPWLPVRARVHRHEFRSENTTLLQILARHCGELGCSGEGLAESLAESREFLSSAAELEVVDASLRRGSLEVTVRVHNRTGHKLPTGIPVRSVYLHAIVRDATGAVVFESGRLAEGGHAILGVDADVDPRLWEPHHDSISSPDQVQVYEGILGTVEGEATYGLLRAGRFLKDNRILPSGLAPAGAPERIRPVGASLADDDFLGGSDQVTYRVDGLAGKLYRVSIELRDQALSYGMVRDLEEHGDDPLVARFLGWLAEIPARSETIAEVSLEVRR